MKSAEETVTSDALSQLHMMYAGLAFVGLWLLVYSSWWVLYGSREKEKTQPAPFSSSEWSEEPRQVSSMRSLLLVTTLHGCWDSTRRSSVRLQSLAVESRVQRQVQCTSAKYRGRVGSQTKLNIPAPVADKIVERRSQTTIHSVNDLKSALTKEQLDMVKDKLSSVKEDDAKAILMKSEIR